MKTRTFFAPAVCLLFAIFAAGNNASSNSEADDKDCQYGLYVTVNSVVQNAAVTVSNGGWIQTHYTNASGVAGFCPPAGTYSIGLSASGYQPGCLNNYYYSNTQLQYVTVNFGWVCGD